MYKQAAEPNLHNTISISFLQLIATLQGNIATKQLQVTILQLGLRNI